MDDTSNLQTALEVYTDGTYKNGKAVWAFIVIKDETILYSNTGSVTDTTAIQQMWNVAAEIEAATQAINWAINNNKNIILISDYKGIQGWASTWKTNNKWTEAYAKLAKENNDKISEFKYVKGHSKNKWNNYVDKLAFEHLSLKEKENNEQTFSRLGTSKCDS